MDSIAKRDDGVSCGNSCSSCESGNVDSARIASAPSKIQNEGSTCRTHKEHASNDKGYQIGSLMLDR
eukprot:COSAG02_NODE_212_length_28729_cov_45.980196_7_plen_67_part_00